MQHPLFAERHGGFFARITPPCGGFVGRVADLRIALLRVANPHGSICGRLTSTLRELMSVR
jgi:hypothetical protein